MRTTSPSQIDTLSAPVETYDYPNHKHATTFLDTEAGRWFMYNRDSSGISGIAVRTASVAGGDGTPATAPTGLSGTTVREAQVDLALGMLPAILSPASTTVTIM